jgi:hypothetical protein
MKNAHLRRYLHSSSLRRTGQYASLLGISGALHLDVFDRPAKSAYLSKLLILGLGKNPCPEAESRENNAKRKRPFSWYSWFFVID